MKPDQTTSAPASGPTSRPATQPTPQTQPIRRNWPEFVPPRQHYAAHAPPPETEYIDRLFLELSQFTQARTHREMELEARVAELEAQVAAAAPAGP